MIEEFGFILGRLKAAGWCWGKSTGKDTLNGFYGSVEGKRQTVEQVWQIQGRSRVGLGSYRPSRRRRPVYNARASDLKMSDRRERSKKDAQS